ncbi:TPA: hypothetical protein QCR24_006068 [Bacillus cereus]|nr:hypothetical protein [Bacillus cereus]
MSAPGSALAAENTLISVNEKKKVGITDVQAVLKQLGTLYYTSNIAGTKIGALPTLIFKSNPDSVDTKVNFCITGTSNDLSYDSKLVEYIGENVFKNTTEGTPKFLIAKYTKTITESIATATTKGF